MIARSSLLVVAALMAVSCTPRPQPPARPASRTETPRPAEVARPAGPAVAGLDRLGALTPRQQALLQANGFFLAPQPGTPGKQATHLFQVYERNDYLQLPSYVTVDLAIDATHAFLDAVLRGVEEQHLHAELGTALRALQAEALGLHRGARTAPARQAAARAVTILSVALDLLVTRAPGDPADADADAEPERPAPRPRRGARPAPARPAVKAPALPPALRADVAKAVAAVTAAGGTLPAGLLRAPVDLTQMKVRGHYTGTTRLRQFFRAMSWLGQVALPVAGATADVELVAVLARAYLGSTAGRAALDRVLGVTTFFAGGPDAADLRAAAARLVKVLPGAARAGADALVARTLVPRYAAELAQLAPPRIQSTATADTAPVQVRILGRRAFEDAVALQALLPALRLLDPARAPAVLPDTMGALGAAALLGSDPARQLLVAGHAALAPGIGQGRQALAAVAADRWRQDAYHGTVHALRALLDPPPAAAPALYRSPGWALRALQGFAAGWAELRHDTILYGEQLGAECDAPDPDPPHGWVEPLPEVYDRLSAVVRELTVRLKAAGVSDALPGGGRYQKPLKEKTELLSGLLDFLATAARLELAGKPLSREQHKRITLIGGELEWLLISLANTDLLSPRDKDMAVVADVFTWRTAGQAVHVAVGHPDLVYAAIPGPKGPQIARGAVMSYRAFLAPVADRLTDEAWRQRLATGQAPPRPAWLAPIYAEPVPAIRIKGEGVFRCGASSGSSLEL